MWTYGNYGNELQLTKEQARTGSHRGTCDDDVAYLRTVPTIRRQLEKLNPENLRRELKEYGAWNEEELADHNENLNRWLWLCCGNITEELAEKGR